MTDCKYLEVGKEKAEILSFEPSKRFSHQLQIDILAVKAHQHTLLKKQFKLYMCALIIISRGHHILWLNECREEWNAEWTGFIMGEL